MSALLIGWMIDGDGFVRAKLRQGVIFAVVIASFLSLGTFGSVVFARLCFALAGLIYGGTAIALLIDLAKRLRVLVKADS